MAKRYVLAGTIAAFLAAANVVYAPTGNITYLPKIGGEVIAEKIFGKYAGENEERFLKSLYKAFPYSEEVPDIIKHAKILGVEPELLMAIRLAENGVDSIAYGIMPSGEVIERYKNDMGYTNDKNFYYYKNEKEKQLHWAAQTVRYYLNEFEKNPEDKDFISYLAERYAPVNALNDPNGLNKYWERNVKRFYGTFK